MTDSIYVHRRILVVDDDRDAADSLALLLSINGHKTFVGYNGRAALELVADEHPEIAFLDITMPDMSGYELCHRIRSKDEGNDMLIFALTGWARAADRQQASDAGFDGHLVKPITIDDLTKLLADPAAQSCRSRPVARKEPKAVMREPSRKRETP
jgi:CheY-like chemotaxis protein